VRTLGRTPRMAAVAEGFGLDLDEAWNKELFSHLRGGGLLEPGECAADLVLEGAGDADPLAGRRGRGRSCRGQERAHRTKGTPSTEAGSSLVRERYGPCSDMALADPKMPWCQAAHQV